MDRRLLSPEELSSGLKDLIGWRKEKDFIKKSVKFSNFSESLTFVNRVGTLAEEADHHPDITFGWGYADIALTTHDRGGITDVDLALARMIDGI